MWLIVVAVLGSLLVLGILFLSVPVHALVRIDAPGDPWLRVRLKWLFVSVSREARWGKGRKKRKPEKPAAKKRGFSLAKPRRFMRALRTPGLPRKIFAFFRDIRRRLKVSDLAVDLTIGTGDPAETAVVFGVLSGIARFFPAFRQKVCIHPVFMDAAFEGCLDATFTVRPITLIPPFLSLALSKPAFIAFRRLRG